MELVAKLSYVNRDDLTFFRGQNRDYQSRAGGSTIYPAIYRGDNVPARELRLRFDQLDQAARLLIERFKNAAVDGHTELRRKRYIQWSILQHYEVVDTPLLDLTHSLRVACSFAQLRAKDPECYVYVFGLPYVTNRITINSEHDIVNIRLLSICPPAALRPYFQEGYMAGTADVTLEFESKTELDFRNRLIAKFAIPTAKRFWGSGFNQIPETALFPKGDKILDLCTQLKADLIEELGPGDFGTFLRAWVTLEEWLLDRARRISKRNLSIREAINELARRKQFDEPCQQSSPDIHTETSEITWSTDPTLLNQAPSGGGLADCGVLPTSGTPRRLRYRCARCLALCQKFPSKHNSLHQQSKISDKIDLSADQRMLSPQGQK